jgi:hypothetical protein
MIEETLRIILTGLGPFKSQDDFVEVTPFEPNHLFFRTRFGNAGYFDVKPDDDGEIKLFRNRRIGVPDEPPILPSELSPYLSGILERAQAETAEFLAIGVA